MLVLALVLAGCGTQRAAGAGLGPVVFVDAAGNRMIVDPARTLATEISSGEPTAASLTATPLARSPASDPVAAPESAPGNLSAPVAGKEPTSLGSTGFGGETWRDADEALKEIEQRDRDRFYLLPDGTGRMQPVQVEQGREARLESREPVGQLPVWVECRVKIPLLAQPEGIAQRLDFPARDFDGRYAGFLVPLPAHASSVDVWSYLRRGARATPLLARVDAEGRVTAIVNNMPTESIPETRFGYARLGGRMTIAPQDFPGQRLAVLDGALLAGRLPEYCLASLPATPEAATAKGLVSLYFQRLQ